MSFVLRKAVHVAPDPSRDEAPGALLRLPAGTRYVDVPASELNQLAPDHFVDDTDATREPPKDWRPPERQAADVAHADAVREADEARLAAKAARVAAAVAAQGEPDTATDTDAGGAAATEEP